GGADGGGDVGGAGLAAEIGGVQGGVRRDALDGAHEAGGGGGLAQVVEHHGTRPEGADGVGDALAHDVEGRAVDGLEHRGKLALGVEIGGGRNAERAGQGGGEVGEDVGVQVG